MKFGDKIVGMIARPEETIKEIADHPYIEEAVFIVGITAILSGISGYLIMTKLVYDFGDIDPKAMEFLNSYMPVITIVSGLIGVVIIWVIASAVVHLIAMALGGEGKFTQMLVVYGYANIPVIIGVVVSLILISFIEPITMTISQSVTMGNSMGPFISDPYFQAMNIISFALRLWSIGLVFMGVRYVHGLNNNRALIAVAIPLLFLLFGIIMTFANILVR